MASDKRWFLTRELGQFAIRREKVSANGRRGLERYPIKRYKRIRDDEEELKKLVTSLNHRIDSKRRALNKVEVKHAFISGSVLEEFRVHLEGQIPSRNYAVGLFGYVKTHFLNFFVNELGIEDPIEWHRIHKDKWTEYLNSKGPRAPKTKRAIVQGANRFMKWLHDYMPERVPMLVFEPITKAKFKALKAEYDADDSIERRRAITEDDWKKIARSLPDEIAPFIQLAYHYGLRRSESLGFKAEDVRNSHLRVERQLRSLKKIRGNITEKRTAILKGKEKRQVPHWFAKPAQAHAWITASQSLLVHPDTLTKKWNEYLATLNLTYDIHDIRHTWVTRAARKYEIRDVMLAAGHKNIETTMRYLHRPCPQRS